MDYEPNNELAALLNDLLEVLQRERLALRTLNRDNIELALSEKLKLDGALRQCLGARSPSPSDESLLLRVKSEAHKNRLLLAHARSCVQGVLELVTGQPIDPLLPGQRAAPRPVALNIRG